MRKNEYCYIGDLKDLRNASQYPSKVKADYILNLSNYVDKRIGQNYTYFHAPIKDGACGYYNYKHAVDLLKLLIDEHPNENILVACAVGQSRSVSIATTAIASLTNQSYEEALHETKAQGVDPHPALTKRGKKYLEEE